MAEGKILCETYQANVLKGQNVARSYLGVRALISGGNNTYKISANLNVPGYFASPVAILAVSYDNVYLIRTSSLTPGLEALEVIPLRSDIPSGTASPTVSGTTFKLGTDGNRNWMLLYPDNLKITPA